ncbi:MAG: twin-arginine translocase subunit TatC [Calditrichaeota bacterium]|nr:MAG: twin-arginine translocase subunit TatC [Calditrichota bacterium]
MEDERKDRVDEGIIGKKASMPFLDHLEELRWRLIKSVMSIILLSFVAFSFADFLIVFIRKPLGEVKLYNIAVTGTFYAYLKVSLITGTLAALPIIFYQIWSFISPGLYKHERKMVIPLVFTSTVLFLIGAAFCFVVVLPISFAFLIGFAGELIENTITIGSYINFVGLLLMAFGFGFQLPLMSYFLAKVGLVRADFLSRGRRYALVIILILGAIITPPDVFTQLLLAIPLYILYEISIIVVRLTQKKDK